LKVLAGLLVAACVVTSTLHAQDIRSRIRLAPRGTKITQAQAEELTLTVTQVATRDIQTWVRTAGSIDKIGKIVTAFVSGPDAALVKAGQRARTFPVESRVSMYQARVVRVTPRGGGARVDVEIVSTGRTTTRDYVVEIVTNRGDFLSVPNEAIIEEGTAQVVYVQTESGQYEPQTIQTGIQGELYTQVLGGVKAGDQVVTFGSFFIDSDYKLKGNASRP
jgi:hypothetical protein